MDHRWTCSCCGETFDTLPMSFGSFAPDNWFGLTEAERNTRTELVESLCVIDNNEFYVCGCLEIPVSDSPQNLILTVWVSVSEKSFRYIIDHWEAQIPPDEPPRFGWLCTSIRGYPRPNGVRCHVFLQSGDMRPSIVLQPTDYPLSVEQHQGITLDRVKEIYAIASGHH